MPGRDRAINISRHERKLDTRPRAYCRGWGVRTIVHESSCSSPNSSLTCVLTSDASPPSPRWAEAGGERDDEDEDDEDEEEELE